MCRQCFGNVLAMVWQCCGSRPHMSWTSFRHVWYTCFAIFKLLVPCRFPILQKIFGLLRRSRQKPEILDFQLKRGAGSYADYANSEVGRISTPVGKYQIVGSTLQGLVDQGILDPNEKFDEPFQMWSDSDETTTERIVRMFSVRWGP